MYKDSFICFMLSSHLCLEFICHVIKKNGSGYIFYAKLVSAILHLLSNRCFYNYW